MGRQCGAHKELSSFSPPSLACRRNSASRCTCRKPGPGRVRNRALSPIALRATRKIAASIESAAKDTRDAPLEGPLEPEPSTQCRKLGERSGVEWSRAEWSGVEWSGFFSVSRERAAGHERCWPSLERRCHIWACTQPPLLAVQRD